MPVNSDFSAETQNPFANMTPEVRASWELGYHDGLKSVAAPCGQAALIAFAVGDRDGRLKDLGKKLAEHKALLGSTERRLKHLSDENDREEKSILPAFGRQLIGIAEWLIVAFYLLLAVVAVSAEFPLSRVTVAEAFPVNTASEAKMELIRDYSNVAIAIVLCLIGFSLKPLFDVLHSGKGHSRWEAVLVIFSFVPCAAAIYGVAQLRETISNPSFLMTASSSGLQDQIGNEESTRVLVQARKAASDDMRKWTAFTFKWVTVSLPLFSAMCLIISARQLHNYRRHNSATRTLIQNDHDITSLDQSFSQMRYSIDHEQDQLEIASNEDPYHSSFNDRSVAAYNHGRATGESDRNRGLPLYEQLKMNVGVR